MTRLFAVGAYAPGTVTDDHRFALRDFFLAVPDLSGRIDDIEGELFKAFRKARPAGFNVYNELQTLVAAIEKQFDAATAQMTLAEGNLPSADELGAELELFLANEARGE